jgi:geranylgeranyl diphosphate synthase type II
MHQSYIMFGGKDEKVIEPFMAAIEMIHTYSLIHDDLPALDNDDYRRGRKTSHVVFGEAMAILAGDALLNYAYETACKAFGMGEDIHAVASAMCVLAQKPGINGMIGGQVIDLKYENKEIDVDTLNILQTCKTGALIEAACVMGVILGDKLEAIPFAADYAQAMGRAFQIVDDILDVTGTFEELGKPIGSDSEQHKNTYVSLLGLDKSEQIAKQLTVQALGHLKYFEDSVFLTELTSDMLTRRS